MWNLKKAFSLRTNKICRFEIKDGVKYVYCIKHAYKFLLREQVGFAAVLWRLRQCVSCSFFQLCQISVSGPIEQYKSLGSQTSASFSMNGDVIDLHYNDGDSGWVLIEVYTRGQCTSVQMLSIPNPWTFLSFLKSTDNYRNFVSILSKIHR